MTKILFNEQGTPLMAYCKTFFATTTGVPANPKLKKNLIVEELDDTVIVGSHKVSPWGDGNDFPTIALDTIGKTGVLNSGLSISEILL